MLPPAPVSLVYNPILINASVPISSKSFSTPDSLALTKNLELFSSKLAFNPASFNWSAISCNVDELLTRTVPDTVPSFFTTLKLVSPPTYPSSARVEFAFVPLSSFPPVRLAACAVARTFNFCVPLTAVFDAVTVAFVWSEDVVFLTLYADENLSDEILVYRLYTFVFNDFQASCFHSSLVFAFTYFSFF